MKRTFKVDFESGGSVELCIDIADVFELSKADREFVFALIDKIQSRPTLVTSPLDPAASGEIRCTCGHRYIDHRIGQECEFIFDGGKMCPCLKYVDGQKPETRSTERKTVPITPICSRVRTPS